MSTPVVTETEIADVLLVVPRRFADARGSFVETYNAARFAAAGIATTFVQDNQVHSAAAGTVRGLHFQAPPHTQAKLVRVLKGRIFDVAVDLRAGSATYGRWVSRILTAEGGEQLFVPRGFAHGYCTLTPDTEVAYKVDDVYAPAAEGGIVWDDPGLAIPWPVSADEAVLADRDRELARFAGFASPFAAG